MLARRLRSPSLPAGCGNALTANTVSAIWFVATDVGRDRLAGGMAHAEWLDALPQMTVEKGTNLLVDGVPTTRMFVLIDGTVRVFKHDLQIDLVDRPGAFLGEMTALLGGAPRATVTAASTCRLRYTEDARELMRREPAVAIGIAETVARRLDLITGYLADLQTQYADRSDHLGVITQVLQTLMHYRGAAIEPGSEREPDPPY